MSNATCLLCGSTGYQGLIDFECDNIKCSSYKAATQTYFVQNNQANVKRLLQFVKSINHQVQIVQTRTPDEQQEIAKEFLRMLIDGAGAYIGACSPTTGQIAVVAGGAPRDWHFKKMAKDIDIFTETFIETWFRGAFPNITLVNKVHQKQSLGAPIKQSNTSQYYGIDALSVFDCTFKGEDFQIIKVPAGKTIQEHIESFDFGINMIHMDRFGNKYPSNEFKKDVLSQTLTTYPAKLNPQNIKYLGRRTFKMKQKFPNFTINIE